MVPSLLIDPLKFKLGAQDAHNACAIESLAMFNLDHLKFVLDDSLHPGTAPAWMAITMAVIVVLLASTFFKPLVGFIRRRRRSGYNACLAYHQKIHEGERW